MTEQQESPERLERPLIRLAKMMGIGTSYVGMSNDYHEISDDVLVAVLEALGIDASSDDAIAHAIDQCERDDLGALVAPTVLHTIGEESRIPVHTGIMQIPEVTLTLENGQDYGHKLPMEAMPNNRVKELDGSFVTTTVAVLPDDIPLGYHTLHVKVGDRVQDATLVSAPAHIEMLDPMKDGALWGWMAQLYSIRSKKSWGVGDYADLRSMLMQAKSKTGADFILVNPLHAAEPVTPLTPSPYLPVSRRFVNFTYIRPENIDEYETLDDASKERIASLRAQVEGLNTDPERIDRDAMWKVKDTALRMIYNAGRSESRQQEFEAYKAECGNELEAYATWCLCYEMWGAPQPDPNNWEVRFTKESPEVQNLRNEQAATLDYYRWLEWIATSQLHAAQRGARACGMQIGIMSDMAVGVHPQGADVWWNPERFAKGATVGAPPDMFNQQGQNWSQPPLSPLALKESGYKVYREMVRGMFDNAGAVRIDHILGLFRLWWIPEGREATDGCYVYYDYNVMLGILAIEATRAGGIVVGEDLGVVPSYVQQSLSQHGILGCAVEWFEQMNGVFIPPKDWRPYALASVETHDMPPAAGYLEYEHVKIRERLGLLEENSHAFEENAHAEHQAMLQMLVDNGFIDPATMAGEEDTHVIVEALYRALKASPCKLLAASFVDAVGERRAQNQPGTNNEYPNWRIPLADAEGKPVLLEDLFSLDSLRELSGIMNA